MLSPGVLFEVGVWVDAHRAHRRGPAATGSLGYIIIKMTRRAMMMMMRTKRRARCDNDVVWLLFGVDVINVIN